MAARHVIQLSIGLGWSNELIRVEDVIKKNVPLDISQYDLIGLGSQVIGYGIPGLVRSFTRKLPATWDGKNVFFQDCERVGSTNNIVPKELLRILKNNHYYVCYDELFSIVSNWIMKYDNLIMKQLYLATLRKITPVCEAMSRRKNFYRKGKGEISYFLQCLSEVHLFLPKHGRYLIISF